MTGPRSAEPAVARALARVVLPPTAAQVPARQGVVVLAAQRGKVAVLLERSQAARADGATLARVARPDEAAQARAMRVQAAQADAAARADEVAQAQGVRVQAAQVDAVARADKVAPERAVRAKAARADKVAPERAVQARAVADPPSPIGSAAQSLAC